MSADELKGLNGLGRRTVREVKTQLRAAGLSLSIDGGPSGESPMGEPPAPPTMEADRPPDEPATDEPEVPRERNDESETEMPTAVQQIYAGYADAATSLAGTTALARLARELPKNLSVPELGVLELRSEYTLARIGDTLGVTRERVRQYETRARRELNAAATAVAADLAEAWRERLSREALTQAELCDGWLEGGKELEAQQGVARLLLRALGAVAPKTFAAPLKGWWTLDPDLILRYLGRVSARLPLEERDLTALLAEAPFSETVPVARIFSEVGSPARFHEGVRAWVRWNARHGDAAYLVLTRSGAPLSVTVVAERVGIKTHTMRESMRRDSRFQMLRPSRDWALTEWRQDPGYRNTLEAAVATLSELGPVAYDAFEQQVLARYPVSPWAVKQTLASVRLGRWPDGRIDLAERGAPPIEDGEPARPPGVEFDEQNNVLTFIQKVDRDLLRGSGLGVSFFVTWRLGLRQAPRARRFTTASGQPLEIRRYLQGAAVSSLRQFAEDLGARGGCQLRVRLHLRTDEAEVSLACADHAHAPTRA
jgi:Sigma-70, region 4